MIICIFISPIYRYIFICHIDTLLYMLYVVSKCHYVLWFMIVSTVYSREKTLCPGPGLERQPVRLCRLWGWWRLARIREGPSTSWLLACVHALLCLVWDQWMGGTDIKHQNTMIDDGFNHVQSISWTGHPWFSPVPPKSSSMCHLSM